MSPSTHLPRVVDKRQAVIEGALTVFAHEGYARASVDAIAAQAGVSTRTIYNHFRGKKDLFRAVVEVSATHVAEAQIAIIDRHLRKITDLEPDLVDFALAWISPMTDFPDHFALVRWMTAEVVHLPQDLIDTWQEAGPRRVMRELAQRMKQLADEGWLVVEDPAQVADHFVLLAAWDVTTRSYYGAVPLERETVERVVRSGVRAFLHGYLPKEPRMPQP